MSGPTDLARLTGTIDILNEITISPEIKDVDVGNGESRPTVTKALSIAATQFGGAMPYTSIEEALTKTVSGTVFSVPSKLALSPDPLKYIDMYLNDEGAPVPLGDYPNGFANRLSINQSSLALELAPSRMLDTRYGWGVADERGYPILGVKNIGVATGIFDELPGLFFLSGEWRYVQTDVNGIVLLGHRWDGTTVVFGVASDANVVPYQVNDSGLSDIWLLANGMNYQLTGAGNNWDPVASDGVVRYMSRVGTNVQQVQQDQPVYGEVAPYVRNWLHILSSSQSLGLGTHSEILTTQPPVANRVFTIAVGLRQSDALQAVELAPESVLPLKPLVSNLQEAPHAQLCASLARHRDLPADAGVIGSCHGIGATTIQNLSKGTVSYNNLIATVTQCKADATARGYGYEVPFVDWIQGEANTNGSQGAYLTALLLLQSDLTTDIGAISGQPNIPLVLCQMSSWTTKNVTTSYVPHEQLQAALENPTKFICAGPKYWLDYHTDGVHLTGKGSVQLGAMHRAPAAAAIARKTWLPTYCTKAVRSGVVVTLSFHTPVGALVRDTANVTDPGNLGLRWIDSTSSATVLSAQVNGNNTVTLTLSGVPTGANPRVGIADIGISGALGGPTTGPRSCLRDSNTELDVFGNPFYNWACHQIISVE